LRPAARPGMQESSSSNCDSNSSSSSSSRGVVPARDPTQPGGDARSSRQRFGMTPLQRKRVKTRRVFDSR
jgi:hypothetical protein